MIVRAVSNMDIGEGFHTEIILRGHIKYYHDHHSANVFRGCSG